MQAKRWSLLVLLLLLLVSSASLLLVPGRTPDASKHVLTASERNDVGGPGAALAAEAASREASDPAGAEQEEQQPTRTQVGQDPEAQDLPEARPEVRIHGRVTACDSGPVQGAEVRLTIRRPGHSSSEKRPKPVTTGADGTFAFHSRGYRDLELFLAVEDARFAVAARQDSFQAVESGQELDLGDIQVTAGGAVRGSVTDRGGIAMPGATVRLHPQGGPLHGHPDLARLFPRIGVDANGSFRIDHVLAGQYRLDATAPQFERQYTDVVTVADAGAVVLEPMRLGPCLGLTGRVSRADGAPVAGARVLVLRARGGDWQRTETDGQGWFRFDHLPDDVYSLAAEAEGFLRQSRHGIRLAESPRVDLTLSPGLTLAGVVRDAVTGQTVDFYAARARLLRTFADEAAAGKRREFQALVARLEQQRAAMRGSARQQSGPPQSGPRQQQPHEGKPQQGDQKSEPRQKDPQSERQQFAREMELQIRAAARRLREQGIDVDTQGRHADESRHDRRGESAGGQPGDAGRPGPHDGGRFAFAGLQEGVYVVDVCSPQHQPLRSQEVELRGGFGPPELALVLQRGLVVSGRVVDKTTGEALRDARVDLLVPRPRAEDGRRLSPLRMLRARLGPPSPGADHFLDTRTDEAGAFRFAQAPAGTYVLMAGASGHERACTEPFVVSGDKGGFELALGRTGVIHGRVTGIPPDAWEDARVVVTDLRHDKTVKVQADLTFRAEDLAPGRYLVRGYVGSQDAYERATARWLERLGSDVDRLREDVDLAPGAAVQFDVRIDPERTGAVAGQVLVDGLGRDAHGCRIRLRELPDGAAGTAHAAAPHGFAAVVDQDGNYELGEVPAGRYRISVRVAGPRAREAEVWHQEILVHAGTRNVQPPVALTAADLRRAHR